MITNPILQNMDVGHYLKCDEIFSVVDENIRVCAKYWRIDGINDSFEKIVVSLDEITLPINGGIGHIQAWRLDELI